MPGPTSRRQRQAAADEALIRALFEQHGKALLAYATRLTSDPAAAEDVVQETLLRAWRHPDALVSGKGSVRGWLFTVARNIITDRAPARAARRAEVAETPHRQPVERDHADVVVDSMVVLQAMDRLSEEHRDVLVEIYFRDRSVSEAAKSLGIPTGTVKSRSYYALRALRESFGGRHAAIEGATG